MAAGLVTIDTNDVILWQCSQVTRAIGNVVGRFGWSCVRYADGSGATAADAAAILTALRSVGRIVLDGGWWFCWPTGSVKKNQKNLLTRAAGSTILTAVNA